MHWEGSDCEENEDDKVPADEDDGSRGKAGSESDQGKSEDNAGEADIVAAESEGLESNDPSDNEANNTDKENIEVDETGQVEDDSEESDSDEGSVTDCECDENNEDDPWAQFDEEEEDLFLSEEEKLGVLDDVLQLDDARMEWENR